MQAKQIKVLLVITQETKEKNNLRRQAHSTSRPGSCFTTYLRSKEYSRYLYRFYMSTTEIEHVMLNSYILPSQN